MSQLRTPIFIITLAIGLYCISCLLEDGMTLLATISPYLVAVTLLVVILWLRNILERFSERLHSQSEDLQQIIAFVNELIAASKKMAEDEESPSGFARHRSNPRRRRSRSNYWITKDNVKVSAPDKEGAIELFEKAMNFYYGDKHQ